MTSDRLAAIEQALSERGYEPSRWATAEGIGELIDELHGVTSAQTSGLDLSQVKEAWIQTYERHRVNVFAPSALEFDIVDIAHHLALQCRFNGSLKSFYSVAQHAVMVSHLVPPEHAFAGLMHDATEAYISDLPKPIKRVMTQYQQVEAVLWEAIAAWAGLPVELPACVHEADGLALIWEARCFQKGGPMWLPDSVPLNIPHEVMRKVSRMPLGWQSAERLFLDRYTELTGIQTRPPLKPLPDFRKEIPYVGLDS